MFKTAVLSNAASILIAHNHLSSIVEPSNEDKEVSKRLISARGILGIDVLDYFIVGDDNYLSFKEQD
ncbi:JAB domain-containing protein [Sporolactobacillus sp. KGMB 08714]|uniref:JAB domain-containing protein n=1 Tax=Sporolactobacillus sp. KGMB 08714 TaxID=3064704 RepID=UPI002FBE8862